MAVWTDDAQAALEQVRNENNEELITLMRERAEKLASTRNAPVVDMTLFADAFSLALVEWPFQASARLYQVGRRMPVQLTETQKAMIQHYQAEQQAKE